MLSLSNDIQIAIVAAGVILAANSLLVLLHFMYKALSESALKSAIRSIIEELDKFADSMENEQKRSKAIQDVKEIIGWQKWFVPNALIGWVIDFEVAAIRKMQQVTNTPDLHQKEVGDSATSDAK